MSIRVNPGCLQYENAFGYCRVVQFKEYSDKTVHKIIVLVLSLLTLCTINFASMNVIVRRFLVHRFYWSIMRPDLMIALMLASIPTSILRIAPCCEQKKEMHLSHYDQPLVIYFVLFSSVNSVKSGLS